MSKTEYRHLDHEVLIDAHKHGSAHDAARAGTEAMMEEAEKILSNPTVRKAFERFLLVAELTKEHKQV